MKNIYEIAVVEKVAYSAHIKADSLEQAKRAVDAMDSDDWEPIRESSEFEKYGGTIDGRTWDVFLASTRNLDFVNKLREQDLIIDADDWDSESTISSELYVAEKGTMCPVCGGVDFEGGEIEIAAGTATQKVWCNTGDCPAVWYDQYTLNGFTLLKEDV